MAHVADSYDLVVIGSGAAGLATAVTAAHLGLSVIVLEKEPQFGGTTAWSGGWLWVPRNPLAVEAGIVEDIDEPKRYLRAELGNGYDEARVSAFLEQAPHMVSFFREKTAVQWIDGNAIPDFHETPGHRTGGRSVCAAPYDARALGARIKDLRPPLDVVAPFGMGIASGADMRHFLFATRAWSSFAHAGKRVARAWADKLLHDRVTHLVAGNALVARLIKSCDDRSVQLVCNARVEALMVDTRGSVTSISVAIDGQSRTITAKRGVVLACGGFPHDLARKADLFPHAPTGREHHSAAPPSNTGDGLRLGESVGADVGRDFTHAGAWCPVSLVPRRDGGVARFPHLIERAKPGLIMVRRNGHRFVNEANSYHDVMQALFAATPPGEDVEAWLICDTTFRRRYGLGRVRPMPFPVQPWLRNGYLKRGKTVAELADACGIDRDSLERTVTACNEDFARGDDRAFGRGTSAYNRIQGEAGSGANPCVVPIEHAPFYAVRIVPGSLGTFAGLRTDASAQVLGKDGSPIGGLYAVGNDMASVMAGRYPAGGITLGPAMTFGFIAAHHAAGVPIPLKQALE